MAAYVEQPSAADEHKESVSQYDQIAGNNRQGLLDAINERTLRVSNFKISNMNLTSPSVIRAELLQQPALWQPSTLADISRGLNEVRDVLMSLDVFHRVDCTITPSEAGSGYCDVQLDVSEKNPLHLTAGTYMQATGEGNGEFQMALRNRLGLAESIQLSMEKGVRGSDQYALSVTRPRPAAKPVEATFRISQLHRSFLEASSFMERTRGISCSVASQDRVHSLSYEAKWRTLSDPSRAASLPVRDQLGHSLKSAVTYAFRRDLQFLTDRGELLATAQTKSTTEVAGLAPGARVPRFLRQQLQGRFTLPLPDSTAFLSLGVDAGLMVPLGRGALERPSSISDRFFSGGTASLRGFSNLGTGPAAPRRQQRPPPPPPPQGNGGKPEPEPAARGPLPLYDHLGGDLYASATAALNFELPFEKTRALGLRGHIFTNLGNTALLAGTGRPVQETLRSFRRDFRATAGIGVVLPIAGLGDLELNWCKPLKFQPTDRIDDRLHGIQIGFAPYFT